MRFHHRSSGSALFLASTRYVRIAFSTEGGDGGAPPAAAAAGDGAPEIYRPDGLSDDLAGASDRETIDKLYGAFKGATTPGEAKDYIVAWDGDHKDALTGAFGNADDPLYSAARDAAVKHGIPPKAFAGLMTDVFGPALANGVLPPPFNPAAEIEAFGKAIGVTDKNALTREVTERQSWATGLGKQLGLSADEQMAFDVLTDTAAGLGLVDKFRGLLGGEGIKVEGGSAPAGAGLSKDELHKLDSDPRIDPDSRTFDPGLRKRYDAAYQKHYG
ncbi:hypothetical protein MKI84_12915 [Ancylobacter sp. A5.8]|uniref:hypothetical protein n=1 Tax=Ancylobacter gelatini TaxID=2919920 RepID=UPI001F4E9DF2|nr:hypothetical protein [Ancylobacter gelatini]MCJ8143818.1 hypothetical protein [Ancylobacter gelatini]